MKRRGFLKFLGMAAAALPVAVKAMPFPEDSAPLDISDYYPGNPTYSDIDWSMSPPAIAAGHSTLIALDNVPWEMRSQILREMGLEETS